MSTPGAAPGSPGLSASSQDVQQAHHPDQIMRQFNPPEERPMNYVIEAKVDKVDLQGPSPSLLLHVCLFQMILQDGFPKWKEVPWVGPRDKSIFVIFQTEDSKYPKQLKLLSLADEAPIATMNDPTAEDDAYYARNPVFKLPLTDRDNKPIYFEKFLVVKIKIPRDTIRTHFKYPIFIKTELRCNFSCFASPEETEHLIYPPKEERVTDKAPDDPNRPVYLEAGPTST